MITDMRSQSCADSLDAINRHDLPSGQWLVSAEADIIGGQLGPASGQSAAAPCDLHMPLPTTGDQGHCGASRRYSVIVPCDLAGVMISRE
jgi:hypothetical protein